MKNNSLPEDWLELQTTDGNLYYYNKITQHTQWNKPGNATDTEDWCWMEDENEAYIPVRITYRGNGKIEYVTQRGQKKTRIDKGYEHIPLSLSSLNKIVDDLVLLDDMNIPLVLNTLKQKCKNGNIYTNVGTILIAINPYKILPLYTPEVMEIYSSRGDKELPPHPFIVGDNCYRTMIETRQNQSILVSGESGAGKTETTKVILQYLAEIAGSKNGIEQKILNATPILEAFGNAKTLRNNNSSRFGKWIEIHFSKAGEICGARILNYLLEKSRVPFQAKDERNYHIFYQLLQGGDPEMLIEFGLTTVEDYTYTYQSGCIYAEGIQDASDFNRVCESMRELGFSLQEMKTIFRIVAAILMIGNIKFSTKMNDDSKTMISSTSIETMKRVARLLCVEISALEKALISREITIKSETTVIPLDKAAAEECRDTLAKHLYGSLFEWLVKRINQSLSMDLKPQDTLVIGVLDIFGFEIFDHNSFEQLCINFTNEKLQQKFNQTTFKEEEAVYQRENIQHQHINFIDNQSMLDLIEKKPDGILCILDDELKMPHKTRSDHNFLARCTQKHVANERFKRPIKNPDTFILVHYAGEVMYKVNGFLDKNKDQMYDDLIKVMMASRDSFVVNFMGDILGKKTSLSAQFRSELTSLMNMINSTNPHYIRCIKPNTQRQPASALFDTPMCLRQLTYAGVFEAISIRRKGYPFRYTHRQFYERYKFISPSVKGNSYLELCIELLKTIPGTLNNVQIGTSMILYKSDVQHQLELRRNVAIRKLIISFQAMYRRYKAKQKYIEMERSRKEIRNLITTKSLEKLKKAVEEATDMLFDFKEIRDANTLIFKLTEEKRLNHCLEEVMSKIQGKQDISQHDVDQLEKILEEVNNFGLENNTVKNAKKTLQELVKRKETISKLLQAVDSANMDDIQKYLSEAKSANIALSKELMQKVDNEMKRLQEELVFVEVLLKVLSVPPNSIYPGISISQNGEVEVDGTAQKVLLDCLTKVRKFGFRSTEGKNAIRTAELVNKIRDATREDNWVLVESLILDTQGKEKDYLDAPEISAASEQVYLRKGIGETIESLQRAAQNFDANMLHVYIKAAQRYDLQGIEPYQELEIKIRRISAALENAIATKNLEKLIAATSMADLVGYCKEDYIAATKARDIVIGLLNELSEHILVVPEKEQMEELLERCRRAQLVNEHTKTLEKRIMLQNEDLIKLQMKGALAVNDHKRVLKKTSQLKELFFKQFGSAIDFKQCPVLRTPSDFVKGKVFGKDKLKSTMLVWSKEIIPSSLTVLNDKVLIKDAIRIFKNIMGWSGDKQLSYPAILAKEVLDKGITHEPLRNEIYAQLVKQINNNPNKESVRKLWQLMHLALKSFTPTAEFENYLEAWFRQHGNERRYCINALHVTQFRGTAKTAPTPEDIITESNRQYTFYRESLIQTKLASQRTSVSGLEDIMRQSAIRRGQDLYVLADENRLFDVTDPYYDFPVNNYGSQTDKTNI